MKILYACLGGGNGHVSRARDIIPYVQELGDVDIAISGTDSQVSLPLKVKHQHHGLIFHLGSNGNLDYWKTLKDLKFPQLLRDIKEFPIENYDLVINDFEPITARAARRAGVPFVSLSHQASFLSPNTPRAKPGNPIAEFIFKRYATCEQSIGFHFESYDSFIKPPVVRKEVRLLNPRDDGHYTVYLPAYGDEQIIKTLSAIQGVKWEVFSKRARMEFEMNNFLIRPINNDSYLASLESCTGLLTGGGFEAPAEAMFLGKKILMVPQKGQFEQLCNAEAAKRLGARVILGVDEKRLPIIEKWISHGTSIKIEFPDHSRETVREAVEGCIKSRY
jgi:uncharacterized protein (TIGR00661 family)